MGHVFDVKTLAINPAGCPDKDQKKDQNSADLGNSQITANEQKEGEKKNASKSILSLRSPA